MSLDVLKRPFGTLIPEDQVTRRRIASMLRGTKVIAVGDATTERLVSFGIIPDVAVVDGKERRAKRSYPFYPSSELRCKNLPGSISEEAVGVLKNALQMSPPVRVLVDGEEDLLALPLFVLSPKGSSILYGQPLEGLVVVRITPTRRKKAKELMNEIANMKQS